MSYYKNQTLQKFLIARKHIFSKSQYFKHAEITQIVIVPKAIFKLHRSKEIKITKEIKINKEIKITPNYIV